MLNPAGLVNALLLISLFAILGLLVGEALIFTAIGIIIVLLAQIA